MAYDINQLLDDLPSLALQTQRQDEQSRQFDAQLAESSSQFDRDFGIRKGTYDMNKETYQRAKRTQESMNLLGMTKVKQRKRTKSYEDLKPELMEKLHDRDWRTGKGLLPESMRPDFLTRDYEKQIYEGRPEDLSVPAGDIQDWTPEMFDLYERYFPQEMSKNEQLGLLGMQGGGYGSTTVNPFAGGPIR